MGRERRILTASPEETLAYGMELVSSFPSGGFFCLKGTVGAGKTTLVKGMVSAVTGLSPTEVTSPTFSYLNIYENEEPGLPFFHFDLYRLNTCEEFSALGLTDYLFMPGFVCMEWSERIQALLPSHAHTIIVHPLSETQRHIEVILCA